MIQQRQRPLNTAAGFQGTLGLCGIADLNAVTAAIAQVVDEHATQVSKVDHQLRDTRLAERFDRVLDQRPTTCLQ